MDVIFLIGRVLFGALFVMSAMGHLVQVKDGSARQHPWSAHGGAGHQGQRSAVRDRRVLGVSGDPRAIMLPASLLSTAILVHAFWKEADPMAKQMEMVQFNKHVALPVRRWRSSGPSARKWGRR